ncbi:MAG: ParB/RepB/Spo0J family partition protein [Solirubrobacterales bacterium]
MTTATAPQPVNGQEHKFRKPKAPDVQMIELDSIEPHPRNPGRHRITDANVEALANDLDANGLQQAIKVRPRPGGRYEIIFGERRYQAARWLSWSTIAAVVTVADDARVGRLQAAENGQRVDLDPISVAEHLECLTGEQADGSAALTQTEAGRLYGISQGEVSNRIRLLNLPKAWKALVISGEISAKQARQLLPYTAAPKLMDVFFKDWRSSSQRHWHRQRWTSGERELADHLENVAVEETRPMDKRRKHDYGWKVGEHPRYFEPTDDQLRKLDVVELPIGKRVKSKPRTTVQVATNAKLWEQLNRKQVEQKAKEREASRVTGYRSRKTSVDSMSAKEKAARKKGLDKKRAEDLKWKLVEWRSRMLRATIAEEIKPGRWPVTAMAIYGLFACMDKAGRSNAHELIDLATAEKLDQPYKATRSVNAFYSPAGKCGTGSQLLDCFKLDWDPVDDADLLLHRITCLALWPVSSALTKNSVGCWYPKVPELADRIPPISQSMVTEFAKLADVTLDDAWKRAGVLRSPQRTLLEQMLTYMRKAELESVAGELGHVLPPGAKAKTMVELILQGHTKASPARFVATLKGRKAKAK